MQPLMLTTMFGGGENYVSFIEHGKWLYYNLMKIFYYYYILFTLCQNIFQDFTKFYNLVKDSPRLYKIL